MHIPRLIIAGTHSGCGKTSVTVGVLRALIRRGLRIQPCKIGPDFIDASLLSAAARHPCRNLDSWMLPHPTVAELLARGAEGAHAAVAEGMMGLYDGYDGAAEAGSTAEVARLLGAPVVLVVDVGGGSARSAAATTLGFSAFDPQLAIAGIIANRAGGPRHVEALREALRSSGIPLLGAIPQDDRLRIPERPLGLAPAAEAPPPAAAEALADTVAAHVDLEALLRIARTAPPLVVPGPLAFPPIPSPPAARIGVARDEAFSFYYPDALELLEAFGAHLVAFSPLHDRSLPEVDGLYLGGGLLEVHAQTLEDNVSMRHAVAAAIHRGVPVHAEGGGLLYLTRDLLDADGHRAAMVGAVPASSRMHRRVVAHDYVTLEAATDTLLLRTGETVRAHEFHWSTLEPAEPLLLAYRSRDGRGIADGRDGFASGSMLATHAHVHLAAMPEMARRLVEACRAYRAGLSSTDERAGSR